MRGDTDWDFTDQCRGCPCNSDAVCSRPEGDGWDVAIVVDYPTQEDVVRDTFLYPSKTTLRKAADAARLALADAGIDIDSCYVTQAVNCAPNNKKEAMLKKAMLACRPRLVEELKRAGVTKVLCLGTLGFSALMSADKNLPITKHRGKWYEAYGMNILPTLPPTMVMGDTDYFRDFYRDIVKFGSTDGRDPYPDLELVTVESVAEMKEMFEYLASASFVSCDVETTGFSALTDDLLAVGFGAIRGDAHDGIAVVLDEALLERKSTWTQISKILASDQDTVFHNCKFDLKWLQVGLGRRELEYAPKNIQDTMMLNYCLDERPMGRFGSHSLKNMARVRCDAPNYDINMGKWLEEWAEANTLRRREMRLEMHRYLAMDVYFTARMYPELKAEVIADDPLLLHHYETLLLPGSVALAEIELRGAGVDRAFFEAQAEMLDKRAAPILKRIQRATNPEFNPGSPKQVSDYLYGDLGLKPLKTARRGKQQEGKTSKQVLKMLKKAHPEHAKVLTDIIEYRNLTKNAGTYVKGLLNRVGEDDRIRCDFLPHGTATGRLACSNPNLQNIPDSSHTKIEIRRGYVARPGWLMYNADYSQLELRVAAWLSGDQNFRQAYIEDRDFHQEVAFALYGLPKEEISPYLRYLAKCCTFGVLYGRGPESLANGPEMDMVEDEFGGTRWTVAEAKGFFDKFFGNFPQYKEWADAQYELGYSQQWVQTPFGNKRRWPLIRSSDAGITGRAAANTPIQGTAALITFGAVVRIHERFKALNIAEGKDVAFVTLTVHDSIMGEFDPAYLEVVKGIILEEMQDNIPLDIDVPMKADVEVAPNWADMKDWDAAENLPAFMAEA